MQKFLTFVKNLFKHYEVGLSVYVYRPGRALIFVEFYYRYVKNLVVYTVLVNSNLGKMLPLCTAVFTDDISTSILPCVTTNWWVELKTVWDVISVPFSMRNLRIM